jgi:GntR family transcriptional regulator
MSSVAETDSRPLYAQVRETLIARIKDGTWKPGQLIPNEFEVAAEFGVSQGTARKAIDALSKDGLLVRRQGIGTFVVEHTPADVLFRFFQVQDKAGKQIKPEGLPARSRLEPASKEARQALGLPRKGAANVIVIERIRFHQKKPFVIERIVVPEALFPALANRDDVPNTLYDLFQKQYGLMVTRADERVTPVLAATTDATALNCAIGTPLLRVERIAYGIDDRKLEWRTSHYNLGDGHYFARLK